MGSRSNNAPGIARLLSRWPCLTIRPNAISFHWRTGVKSSPVFTEPSMTASNVAGSFSGKRPYNALQSIVTLQKPPNTPLFAAACSIAGCIPVIE